MHYMKVSSSDFALAKEFVHRLAEQVDPHLFTVTLFGSRARGNADEESDLDLFVALREDDLQGEVKEAASRIACDLTLESGILVSVFVVNKTFLNQHQGFALLETIEEEGVPL
jgi:predicted nucleotidyltransferase